MWSFSDPRSSTDPDHRHRDLLVLVRWSDCWRFPFSAQNPTSVTEPHVSPKVWTSDGEHNNPHDIWKKTSGSFAHTETWWCFTPSSANRRPDLLPAPLPPLTGSQPTRHLSLTLHPASPLHQIRLTPHSRSSVHRHECLHIFEPSGIFITYTSSTHRCRISLRYISCAPPPVCQIRPLIGW